MRPTVETLADFGLTPMAASKVAQRASSFSSAGVTARLAQLRFGVDSSIITSDEARTLVTEQPDFLQLDFRTAFEDNALVAVAKPWDARLKLDKVGERWDGELTLVKYLEDMHSEVLTDEGEVRLCHQLDFATSGLIVSAKSRVAADAVARCFREREARKLYAALVFGHPSWDRARWEERIMPSKRKFKQRISGGGKTAVTDVTVGARGVLRLGTEHEGREASLLWLEPRTGRRHQLVRDKPEACFRYACSHAHTEPVRLRFSSRNPAHQRLHCAHHGHGIVGDMTYADDRLAYRTFLHAAALELPLRLGGKDASPELLQLEAPLSPISWAHAFEPTEPIRNPEGWPSAVEELM